VISANDVATYGSLCALATFDRIALRTKILQNSDFKQYLEQEPTMREIIEAFYNSNYKICLETLDRIKVKKG